MSRNTTFMENSIQKMPSEMAGIGISCSMRASEATTPLTIAAPVGISVFAFSCENTLGMLPCLAA